MEQEGWIGSAAREALLAFQDQVIGKLSGVGLHALLRRSNPYLLRAIGLKDASEVIDRLLTDYLSASDQTVFGRTFIETLCSRVPGVEPSGITGIDFKKNNALICVKSGASWGNSSQWSALIADFLAAKRAYKTHPVAQEPECVLGVANGRGAKRTRRKALPFTEKRGQEFWGWLTGDNEFYLKIMRVIDDNAGEYTSKIEGIKRRLRQQFTKEFCGPGGEVHWGRLIKFVSESVPEKDGKVPREKAPLQMQLFEGVSSHEG